MKKTNIQKVPSSFGCFTFSDDESRQALIDELNHTPLERLSIEGKRTGLQMQRPLVVIEGPPGSGKTRLARKIMQHHGVTDPAMMPVCDEEEMRKLIPALLGQKYVCFDSVRQLGGETLPAFITADSWCYRKFGTSKLEKKTVRTRVIATGEKVKLSLDLEFRVRRIRLEYADV